MFAARLGLRAALRTGFRPAVPVVRRTPLQRRCAAYQQFPGRGANYGRSSQQYSSFRPFARAQFIWRNYKPILLVIGVGGGGFYVYNLEEVPITGRRRFNVISPETELQMTSQGGYEQTLNEFRGRILPASHPYTQIVAKVVTRLLPTTGGLAGDDWKVHVIDDPDQINAFVMPGGKVFVFTGILPICQDENGLAAVLGHEIAHNVAHHLAERLSSQIPVLLATLVGSAVFDVSGQLSSQLAELLLSLPNSRTQESEADHIGLLMMAQACYDPSRVPALWRRMAEAEKFAPPQFLSTHPASAARAEVIQGWMPEAMDKYHQSGCASGPGNVQEFKKIFVKQQAPRGIPREIFSVRG